MPHPRYLTFSQSLSRLSPRRSNSYNPLVEIDGVTFLVVFNDTHYNNSYAYRVYLGVLVECLPPCPCGSPTCRSHLLLRDRFAVHESPEIAESSCCCAENLAQKLLMPPRAELQ